MNKPIKSNFQFLGFTMVMAKYNNKYLLPIQCWKYLQDSVICAGNMEYAIENITRDWGKKTCSIILDLAKTHEMNAEMNQPLFDMLRRRAGLQTKNIDWTNTKIYG